MDLKFHQLSFPHGTTIDVQTDSNHLYRLTNISVEIYGLSAIQQLRTLDLQYTNQPPTTLFVDNESLIIGYKDGIMEMRLIQEDYGLLRLTDLEDASGPGSAIIQNISASESYVLAQAHENGLLIYSKPSLLFYKWIMIGGHTIIRSVSIRDHLLYILTDDNEIHLLNFNHHRLYEQQVHAYQFVDIEFDGLYLYVATSSSVLVYLPSDDPTDHKPKLSGQINFQSKIEGLFMIRQSVMVLFADTIIQVELNKTTIDQVSVSKGQQYLHPSSQIYRNLKYHYWLKYHDSRSDFTIVSPGQSTNEHIIVDISNDRQNS